MQKLDLLNQTFERLTVIAEDGRTKQGKSLWVCKCSCQPEDSSVTVIITGSKLTGGWTKSCGCLQREAARKTGNKFKHLLVHGDRSGPQSVRKTDRSAVTIPSPVNDYEPETNTL